MDHFVSTLPILIELITSRLSRDVVDIRLFSHVSVVRECFSPSGFSQFSYHELMKVTGNWDDRPISMGGKKLGEGGFGIVYKGRLNNTHVAVKKLNTVSIRFLEDPLSNYCQLCRKIMLMITLCPPYGAPFLI